jgi:uncharacterized protein (TIGR02118 family)
MVRLIVLYGHPDDPAAFDRHFQEIHAPLCEKIPHHRDLTAGHVRAADDGPAPYYLSAELTFDTLDDLQAGMGGPEGQAAVADVATFATGGTTSFVRVDV